MSVELTMELNKEPSVKNMLVITDHFTHYVLVFVMKDQTAKTVAKILYECFILMFGMPAKLLSDCGMNLTSALLRSCVPHLAYRNVEPLPIMHSVMGRWTDFTRPYSG